MNKDISKVWIQGTSSTCLVIPKKVALEYGLTDESRVVVEGTKDGILIRKLQI
jgi:bifunctional DNA-binding transcriptional regulator/antitoxin component of YhaV-PrlF toxin-antitoxin module